MKEEDAASGAWGLLVKGLRLGEPQQVTLIQAGWVIFVSFHIAWVCGLLGFIGLPTPYASAEEAKQQQASIAMVQQSTATISRVILARELRDQFDTRCSTKELAALRSLESYIDYLQNEYQKVAGQRYPDPGCRP